MPELLATAAPWMRPSRSICNLISVVCTPGGMSCGFRALTKGRMWLEMLTVQAASCASEGLGPIATSTKSAISPTLRNMSGLTDQKRPTLRRCRRQSHQHLHCTGQGSLLVTAPAYEPGRTAYEARFAGEKQGPRGTVGPWEMLPLSAQTRAERARDSLRVAEVRHPLTDDFAVRFAALALSERDGGVR
ncbi:hypothetical protein [Methylobacterium gnaphalii]|uniref:hypothetical protein n=1 Tax=Methylobacterium gnaphalii TaxID=1010610 RepID=UPI001FCEF3F4|nr:hypothetical protein [Methylobacterium gnaphalii]